MKKILALPTVIVFLLTILIAGGCGNGNKTTDAGYTEGITDTDTITSEHFPLILGDDSTNVGISLRDTFIDCKVHLLMENVSHKGPHGKEVIDSLYTDVYPGYTVTWAKKGGNNIKKVHHVRIINLAPWNLPDSCFVAIEDTAFRGAITLEIPLNADTGIVKYEIIFEDNDKKFWCIDPYLRIPDD